MSDFDLPPGFFRVPGCERIVLAKRGVIGVLYVEAVPEHEELSIPYYGSFTKYPVPRQDEYCVLTVDGGDKYIARRINFWSMLELLK